ENRLRAAHRARHVVADLEVPATDGLPPELRIEGEDLLDLDARDAEVVDEPVDVGFGDVAALFLNAPQAGQHERGVGPRGEARLPRLEVRDWVLHRSPSPPIMFTDPKVGMMSAS